MGYSTISIFISGTYNTENGPFKKTATSHAQIICMFAQVDQHMSLRPHGDLKP